MLRVSTLAAAALAAAVPASAEQPSLRALIEMTGVSSLSISPDSKLAAFREDRASIDTDRHDLSWWVVPIDGSAAPRRLADAGEGSWQEGALTSEPALWSSDSKTIYFRALRGAELQLWRATIDGASVDRLTDEPGNVRQLALGLDGQSLLFTEGPARAIIDSAEDDRRDAGTLIDATVDPNQALYRGGWIDGRWATEELTGAWFGHGGLLGDQPPSTHVLDLRTGVVRDAISDAGRIRLTPKSFKQAAGEAVYQQADSGDGRGQAFILETSKGRHLRVHRGPDGGPIDCEAVSCRAARLLWTGWEDKSDSLIFAVATGTAGTTIYRWHVGSRVAIPVLISNQQLDGDAQSDTPCAIGANALLCSAADANLPPQLVAINLDTGAAHVLAKPNPTPKQPGLQFRSINWRDARGRAFTGELMMPAHPSGPVPLVINYYSCRGYIRGGVGEETPMRALAQAGIAALCVNSHPFVTSGHRANIDNYRIAQSGIEAIVHLLSGQGAIDRKRVGMAGISFGGECAMWIAIHSRMLAAVSIANVMITPTYYWFGALAGRTETEDLKKEWGIGDPDRDGEGWARLSPSYNIQAIEAPILFQNPEVEYRPNIEIVARLQRAHKAVELWGFPQEGHIKWWPRHQFAANVRNLDWFRYWLQGLRDPAPEKRQQYLRWDALRADQLSQLRAQRSVSMIGKS